MLEYRDERVNSGIQIEPPMQEGFLLSSLEDDREKKAAGKEALKQLATGQH
jgi:hypothetical protein